MLSRQVLLKTLYDIKGITGAEASIWSAEGVHILGTDTVSEEQEQRIESYLYAEAEDLDGTLEVEGAYISAVCDGEDIVYLLMLEGLDPEAASIISSLCINQLENLIEAYKEKINKNSFLQNLLRGNIAEEDIISKAEKVRVGQKAKRVVYVIESKTNAVEVMKQTLKSMYVSGMTDFVIDMDTKHVVLIKELLGSESEKDIQNIARTIVDTLNVEAMLYVRVGYSAITEELVVLEKSYREAKMALEVGKSFYAERTVLSYKELGIGRLIHQLPISLCDEFLQEVLNGRGLEQFDEETMLAAYKFFDNNLNISETARQLYIHRNTLMYRLEKIQKKTGLDVRIFDDAMAFKIAIMVSNHMNYVTALKG